MKKNNKKIKISYYVGWGTALGAIAGELLGLIFCDYFMVVLFSSVACGAAIGGVYGKERLKK